MQRAPLVSTAEILGVPFQIALLGSDDLALVDLARRGHDLARRVEQVSNLWSETSELSALNRSPSGPAPLSAELAALLGDALEEHARSEGWFDPTLAPTLRRLGLYGPTPGSATDDAVERGGVDALGLELDPPRLRRSRPVELDLSGIAKGHAVDLVVELLRGAGIESGLVAAGASTVRAFGPGPAGEGWPLEPFEGAPPWHLVDEAVSTSEARNPRVTAAGEPLVHVVDPNTHRPIAHDTWRVVYLGPSATEADALSTALLAMGADRAGAWWPNQGSWTHGRAALLWSGTDPPRILGGGP